MPKYVEFILKEEKPKTQVYGVYTKAEGYFLGEIKWFPHWRKYAFFPANHTVFEEICLNDIIIFLNEIMGKRKKKAIG